MQVALNSLASQLQEALKNPARPNIAQFLSELSLYLTKISTLLSGSASTPAPLPTPSVPGTFVRPLSLGSRGEDVSALQNFLVRYEPELYPEALVTGYYGELTYKAVGRFQEKYGLAGPNDRAHGYFGPQTRAKVNALIAGGAL
jgi:peptidoglycan hydrolase-like protein with peptidoglycan-binding domain